MNFLPFAQVLLLVAIISSAVVLANAKSTKNGGKLIFQNSHTSGVHLNLNLI